MKTPRILIAISVFTILAGTAFTQTPIIKLTVPVQMTTLNEGVEAVRVWFFAYKPAGQGDVADGAVDIPCPADGNINQTVVVQLKQKAGQDIREATTVGGALWLKVNGNWVRPSTSENAPVEYRVKPGTHYIFTSDADIPW